MIRQRTGFGNPKGSRVFIPSPFGRERIDLDDFRINQSASDELSGHISSFEIFGGRGFAGTSVQRSSSSPLSVRPRNRVISPNGRRRTLAQFF